MKLTVILAITLGMVALGTASPLHITKAIVKKFVSKNKEPTVRAIVYTPVVAPPPPPIIYSQPSFVAAPPKKFSPAALHAKLSPILSKFGLALGGLPGLQTINKIPGVSQLLQHPWLQAAKLPLGGVSVVNHETPDYVVPVPATVPETVVHEEIVELPEPTIVEEPFPYPPAVAPLPVAPVAPVVPVAPVAPVVPVAPVTPVAPVPVYGLPPAGFVGTDSASSGGSWTNEVHGTDGLKYVAVNLGARHEAPLPAGYDHSVVIENLQPAPGTTVDNYQLPPVESNFLETGAWNPVVLQQALPEDTLRSVVGGDLVDFNESGDEVKYIAINNGVRHEAPLPGYERSIVIKNLDTV